MIKLIAILLLALASAAPTKKPLPQGEVNHPRFLENNGTNGKSCWFDNPVHERDYIQVSGLYLGYCHSSGTTKTGATFGLAVVQFPGDDASHWTVALIDPSKI